MNKDLIKYGLIALGAYLIYEYLQKNGGLSSLFGTTAAAGTVPIVSSVTATGAPIQTPGAVPPLTSVLPPSATTVIAPPPVSATPASTPVGTVQVIGGTQYTWNGSAWLASNPVPSVPLSTISQQMQKAAGTNSLDMFQWSYYYTQITGQPSPADPNAIDPAVYAGAGIVDSSTPTDVGTWLAIMQNQAPQLGLTGFRGLGAMRYTPAWLM